MEHADNSIPLAELVPSWKVTLQAEGKSEKTLKHYLGGVTQFLRWCERTGTPAALDRDTVKTFVAALLADGKETSTAVARYQALRQFSRWLVAEGELEADGLLGTKPPKLDVKAVVPLTDTELKKLIAACRGDEIHDRRDEAIVRLMAETGLRANEVVSLKVTDVDVPNGRAVIRRGKGGKGRVVPFNPQTARALDRYIRARRTHNLAAGPDLWLGERGRGFQYTGLYRALNRRAKLAGIGDFHPHLLRNTYASRWLAKGGTEGGLMAVAGWSNRSMLDRYTRATASERAAEEAKRLNLGDI